MNTKDKNGISLIVLVITILVMIILAGVVIVSLQESNPIDKAKEAVVATDLASYKDELNLNIINNLTLNDSLHKEEVSEFEWEKIKKYIPSMKKENEGKVVIAGGELVEVTSVPCEPVIKAGLTPIKWNDKKEEVNTTVKDKNWYNYYARKWANAKGVDGSYFVWIPRFAYKITYYDNDGNIIGYSDKRGLVDKNGNASTSFSKIKGKLEIKFVDVNTTETEDNYIVHPAFSSHRRAGYIKKDTGNYGWDAEVPGFWVAKYEMSVKSKSIPNVSSERNINFNTIYTKGIELSKTVLGEENKTNYNSMNITNTQWGAVAYLTEAIGSVPSLNNSKFLTGGGNYKNNVSQSTTYNVTGVYDTNGGSWEVVTSSVGTKAEKINENKNDKTVDVYLLNTEPPIEDTENNAIKYHNKLNYELNADKYGDAMYETSRDGNLYTGSWYKSDANYAHELSPIIVRGGVYIEGYFLKPGIFAFDHVGITGFSYGTWRGVLTI